MMCVNLTDLSSVYVNALNCACDVCVYLFDSHSGCVNALMCVCDVSKTEVSA